MPETYRMWKIVRILRTIAYIHGYNHLSCPPNATEEQIYSTYALKFAEISLMQEEPAILRTILVSYYVKDNSKKWLFFKIYKNIHLKMTDPETIKSIENANSILKTAISCNYIEINQKDTHTVAITHLGKKFSGIDGLCRAWADDLDILWTVVVTFSTTVLAYIGALHWQDIYSQVKHLL